MADMDYDELDKAVRELMQKAKDKTLEDDSSVNVKTKPRGRFMDIVPESSRSNDLAKKVDSVVKKNFADELDEIDEKYEKSKTEEKFNPVSGDKEDLKPGDEKPVDSPFLDDAMDRIEKRPLGAPKAKEKENYIADFDAEELVQELKQEKAEEKPKPEKKKGKAGKVLLWIFLIIILIALGVAAGAAAFFYKII